MASIILQVLQSGKKVYRSTGSEQVDFSSIRIGGSLIVLSDSSGALDVGGVEVTNAGAPTGASGLMTRGYAESNFVQDSEVGVAGGVASLDGGGKVPVAQLPSSVMTYEGVWDASTNSPSLADGVGDAGQVYRVGTAGSQDLGSGSIAFEVGDYVIYNGTTWEKSDTTDAVASVNGLTGVVVLSTTEISEGSNLYYTQARFDSAFGAKSTTDLSEGTNLYYTQARFDSAFGAKSTSDLAEGSNLYFTDARARTAAVADSISDGVTNIAPSQNAVFDALALKADVGAGSDESLTNDNAGAVTVGQLVYVKSNGNMDLAQANAAATVEGTLAFVKDASIASAASGAVTFAGIASGFSGLTPGAMYFADPAVAGGITATSPSTVGHFRRPVLQAISATKGVVLLEEAAEILS